jgi:hypothetical protein
MFIEGGTAMGLDICFDSATLHLGSLWMIEALCYLD